MAYQVDNVLILANRRRAYVFPLDCRELVAEVEDGDKNNLVEE